MNRDQVLQLIDDHKNKLVDPTEMLKWVYLRVFILSMSDEHFNYYMQKAQERCST